MIVMVLLLGRMLLLLLLLTSLGRLHEIQHTLGQLRRVLRLMLLLLLLRLVGGFEPLLKARRLIAALLIVTASKLSGSIFKVVALWKYPKSLTTEHKTVNHHFLVNISQYSRSGDPQDAKSLQSDAYPFGHQRQAF